MLGRTANGLFWMFRYLERAENTARLLDAAQRMALTQDIASAESEWRSVIETVGKREAYEAENGTYSGIQVWNYLLRDQSNPSSVRAMMGSVRQNARLARNAISAELWSAINEGWLQMESLFSRPITQSQLGQALDTVKQTGRLAHGAMAGSMIRDAGFHFACCGMYIERGDSTARILDMKYYLLLPSLSYVGSSLDTGQWEHVLRSVSGDRGFRYLNAGQLHAREIVEFLVLDDRFPRSLAFSHSALRDNLAALARIHGIEGQSNEMMREADIRLSELTADTIFEEGLHHHLLQFQRGNAQIAQAIIADYRFLD